MRILLLCHSFNSLSQRLFVELRERGHEVSVEFDVNDAVTGEAVKLFAPDLIVAPFLKRAIPAPVWQRHVCLVVHPGPVGDGGPTALDWAILDGESEWGVTVLRATGDLDAGPVLAHRRFPMRAATKSSLYRNEIADASVSAVLEVVDGLGAGAAPAEGPSVTVRSTPALRWRNAVRQADRAIDWERNGCEAIVRKIASGDGVPGVRDRMFGREVFLFDARCEVGAACGVRAGEVVARSGPAIACAAADGLVWIGRVRLAEVPLAVKLPATLVFAAETAALPERNGYRDIWYDEADGVGTLQFPFYNGAMGSGACQRLLAAFREAASRPTRVIVLAGGADFWSNGLDLNLIEDAASSADASWENINAIDDLAEAIVRTTSHMVVSALAGNAGAGGVFLARAADEVWLRSAVVLNPHYKDMGNLFGSELWTYLLPRYAGRDNARRISEARLPMGAREARRIGLADRVIDGDPATFAAVVGALARELARVPNLGARLAEKAERRARDEAERPLALYREEELRRMRSNFYGFDPSYHVARYNFVHKIAKSRTPVTLARHRNRHHAANAPTKEVAQ